MADYEKMWEELGMNMELHDQLCQVLPTAFGDVYLSQENRPEGMGFWDFVVSGIHGIRPAELIEAQKNGQKVFGTFCVYVPDEVVIAAKGIVTGLCGGSQFWVPGGEKVLPKSTCPLIKASVGARLDKTCPFFRIADMYVGETTCDGKKKAWEILGEDVPMHIMDIPQMKREKDIVKWAGEIEEFKKVVEDFTGNKITVENLNEAIKIINNKRKALGRVCPEGTKRILVTGTPLAIPNWKLHHIVETSGAIVVCEEMCTGTRYFENMVEENLPTLEAQYMALARRYMKTNCACFTPNTARFDDILRMVDEYKVDGVIDVNLKFCNLYDTEGFLLERTLKEKGIPVLGIETDYTDADAEQLKTRIGAFIEMLG